jgi:hypothetical protein
MSNLYTLTARTHELLPQVKAKYGLKFEVEPTAGYITERGDIVYATMHGIKSAPKIEEKQIRQILVGLQKVFEKNPDYDKRYNDFYDIIDDGISTSEDIHNFLELFQLPLESQAEALCQKWLGSLTPMFDTNPTGVLEEMVEVLENLLK